MRLRITIRLAATSAAISTLLVAAACSTGMIRNPPGDSPARPGPGGTGTTPPAGSAVAFRPDIQEDIEASGCLACHAAGAFPMKVTASPSGDSQWMANYDEVVSRTDVLVTKATGGAGHAKFLEPGSAVVARWEAWIEAGAPFEPMEDEPSTPPPTGGDAGTGDPVDPDPIGEGPITWATHIQPIVESAGCTECHGDRGRYSMENLDGVMAAGSDDVPNVVPGDGDSLLVRYCRNGHEGIGYRDALTIMMWVVDFDAMP